MGSNDQPQMNGALKPFMALVTNGFTKLESSVEGLKGANHEEHERIRKEMREGLGKLRDEFNTFKHSCTQRHGDEALEEEKTKNKMRLEIQAEIDALKWRVVRISGAIAVVVPLLLFFANKMLTASGGTVPIP